jgi:hypothetical protein
MGAAIKHMKHCIMQELSPTAEGRALDEAEAKQRLADSIDKFLTERVELAQVRHGVCVCLFVVDVVVVCVCVCLLCVCVCVCVCV